MSGRPNRADIEARKSKVKAEDLQGNYRTKDVAKLLGVSRQCVNRLALLGHIKTTWTVGKRIYSAEEINRYIGI